MICQNCNKEIKIGQKYCTHCGSSVNFTEQSLKDEKENSNIYQVIGTIFFLLLIGGVFHYSNVKKQEMENFIKQQEIENKKMEEVQAETPIIENKTVTKSKKSSSSSMPPSDNSLSQQSSNTNTGTTTVPQLCTDYNATNYYQPLPCRYTIVNYQSGTQIYNPSTYDPMSAQFQAQAQMLNNQYQQEQNTYCEQMRQLSLQSGVPYNCY